MVIFHVAGGGGYKWRHLAYLGKNANICLQKHVLILTAQQFQLLFQKQMQHALKPFVKPSNKPVQQITPSELKGLVPVLCSFHGKSNLKQSACAPRKMRRSTRGKRGLWRWTCCRAMASKNCWQGLGKAKEFLHAKIDGNPLFCSLLWGFVARFLKKTRKIQKQLILLLVSECFPWNAMLFVC